MKKPIGRVVGSKQNILVFNDEAHHAYRIRRPEPDESEAELFGEDEDVEAFFQEATVWVDGLDRIHKLRGINFCVDLSATPYYLGRVGRDTNRTFPWVMSDFGLTDAIESGLVKIPQLAVRDTTGREIPGYFNIWRWILPQLTPAERGSLWEGLRRAWEQERNDPRPPVFIVVCKNTSIARVVYDWLAEDKPPMGIPSANLPGLRNCDGCSTPSALTRRWCTTPTPARLRPTKPPGCASRSTPLARPTGRATARAAHCILKVLASWRRSWSAPYTSQARCALHC
jgi:type III restriction enzyme